LTEADGARIIQPEGLMLSSSGAAVRSAERRVRIAGSLVSVRKLGASLMVAAGL
jgi:hypothetical protein